MANAAATSVTDFPSWKWKESRLTRRGGCCGTVSFIQNTFNAMDAMERKIDNLDFQTLSSEYLKSFVIALENLKQTVRNKLDTTSQPSKNLA